MTRMTFSPGWAHCGFSGRGAFAIGKLGLTSLMDGFIYATGHSRYRDGSHTRPMPANSPTGQIGRMFRQAGELAPDDLGLLDEMMQTLLKRRRKTGAAVLPVAQLQRPPRKATPRQRFIDGTEHSVDRRHACPVPSRLFNSS
jgi:hypothetical protein